MRKPTLTLTHPEGSRDHLLSLSRKMPGAYVGIKIAAFLLILEGQRPEWIAQVLGVTRQSLNLWIHRINEQGLISLRRMEKPGRPTRLTQEMCQELQQQLEKSPVEYGLRRTRWDGPTLKVHLKRHFGIRLKVRQVQYWMHRLGYGRKGAGRSYFQTKQGGPPASGWAEKTAVDKTVRPFTPKK